MTDNTSEREASSAVDIVSAMLSTLVQCQFTAQQINDAFEHYGYVRRASLPAAGEASRVEELERQVAERDALLGEARDSIADDRHALFECHKRPDTGQIDPRDRPALRGIREYDALLAKIDALKEGK